MMEYDSNQRCARCDFHGGFCVCKFIKRGQVKAYRALGEIATIDRDGTVTVGLPEILKLLNARPK